VDLQKALPPKTGFKYVIIGAGQVGRTIIEHLLLRGEDNITAVDIADAVAKDFAHEPRVKFFKASVVDEEKITEATKNADTVFITFALIKYYERLPHQYAASHKINVDGTETVIKACITNNVKMLIQTSSSNVLLSKVAPLCYDMPTLLISDDSPYPTTFGNHYIHTKVLAEQTLLKANNRNGKLLVGAIRPCSGIFGYKDKLISEQGIREKIIVSIYGDTVIDLVYVENISYAHLLLERKLMDTPDAVSGQGFLVSNNQVMTLLQFYGTIAHMYDAIKIWKVYRPLFWLIGFISEQVQVIGKGKWSLGQIDLLTIASLKLMNTSYVGNCDKAERLLGYKPLYTIDEGVQKMKYLYDLEFGKAT